MIAPTDIDRLLAEIGSGNLVDRWAERNGMEENVIEQLKEMGVKSLATMMDYSMREIVMEKLEEDEDLYEQGEGFAIVSGQQLMQPVVETLAVCFFQIGWEAHKQYGVASTDLVP